MTTSSLNKRLCDEETAHLQNPALYQRDNDSEICVCTTAHPSYIFSFLFFFVVIKGPSDTNKTPPFTSPYPFSCSYLPILHPLQTTQPAKIKIWEDNTTAEAANTTTKMSADQSTAAASSTTTTTDIPPKVTADHTTTETTTTHADTATTTTVPSKKTTTTVTTKADGTATEPSGTKPRLGGKTWGKSYVPLGMKQATATDACDTDVDDATPGASVATWCALERYLDQQWVRPRGVASLLCVGHNAVAVSLLPTPMGVVVCQHITASLSLQAVCTARHFDGRAVD